MVTPFDAQGRVDEEAAVNLMHHLVDHGSDGLVVCGTTGEAATLTDEEHLRMVELAVREMRRAATIIAGAGSNDTRHAVHLTERATEARRRRDPLGHAVLQQAQPRAGSCAPLRGGRAGDRQAGRPLQHPVAATALEHAATTCSPSWRRSSTSTASSRPTTTNLAPIDGLELYAGNDDTLRPHARHGRRRRHPRGQPRRRRRDAPHGRRARAAGRDRRRAAATSTRRCSSPPTRSASRPR